MNLKEQIRALRKDYYSLWPEFGVPKGCERAAKDAYNQAIDQVLDLIKEPIGKTVAPEHRKVYQIITLIDGLTFTEFLDVEEYLEAAIQRKRLERINEPKNVS